MSVRPWNQLMDSRVSSVLAKVWLQSNIILEVRLVKDPAVVSPSSWNSGFFLRTSHQQLE